MQQGLSHGRGSALLREPRAAALHCRAELSPRPPARRGSGDHGKGWLLVTPWARAAGEGRLGAPHATSCFGSRLTLVAAWLPPSSGATAASSCTRCSVGLLKCSKTRWCH